VTFSTADVDPAHSLTPGTYYVQTQWDDANSNWQFRVWNNTANTAVEVANLGSTGPSFTADWQNIQQVPAESDGRRVFPSGTGLVIEFGVEYQSGSVSTGGAAELLLGVPAAQVALTFHGGDQTGDGMGDTLRIAGDGHATGAVYQPSSSVPGGGTVTISGNSLAFSGVEPLIVHGLPDFKMLTPDLAAALIIDSAQLADVARQQLQLHTLTVEGQVTWTQKKQFVLENPALDPRQVGRAIAVSDDGLTMIVGAKATAGGATVGELTDGLVLVYQWNGSAWIEKARLEPKDLRLGLNFGVDFGASVAIDGNRLIVGSPGDAPAGASNYGAAYIFERSGPDGVWIQTQKLLAGDPGANRYFGASVAIRGNAVLVGAPGAPGANASEATYFFTLDSGNWQQRSKQTGTGDFGRSVALAVNFAVIGAPAADAVSVYHVTSTSLTPWQTLTATVPQTGEQFGAAVAATSQQVNRIVVGAPAWDQPVDYAYAGDPAETDAGRAFIFDLSGSSWVRVARLTADGGLPEAEAARERSANGARFGAAVALDSQYVVVGAPGYQAGTTLQVGAAYVFYELHNGTTGANGSSWTRSTGGTLTSSGGPGSGRLQAASPAANDNFGQAVAVWHDPITGAGRTMVGIPGFDETTGTSRTNLGAVRTFTTAGNLPAVTLASLYAEKLPLANPSSMTVYDPVSRTLFVSDKIANSIYTYVNEGLYWRPSTTLTGWISGKTAGFGIDMDLDAVNGRLAVGTTADYVYVFQRQADGKTWGNNLATNPGKAISDTGTANTAMGVGQRRSQLNGRGINVNDPDGLALGQGADGRVAISGAVNHLLQIH
jgi:hypothetical protein